MEGEACPSPKELEMVKKRKTRQRKPLNARKGHHRKGALKTIQTIYLKFLQNNNTYIYNIYI